MPQKKVTPDQVVQQPAPEKVAPAAPQETILKELDLDKTSNPDKINFMKQNPKVLLAVFGLLAILGGVGTGFAASRVTGSGVNQVEELKQVSDTTQIQVGDIFGIKDEQTFKDSAEGYLAEGDPDMEGSHQLLRPGGASQTVYLTSSVTDLDKFVGMQVRVKGETFKGQKVGWLMDVGQVEVLQLDAQPPEEE